MLSLGVVLVALLFIVAHRSARLAVCAALVALCFVPVWIGVGLGFNGNLFLPVATVAALGCGAALLPLRGFRFSIIDGLLVFLVVVAASSLITSDTALALAFLVTPFAYFTGGYALGRLASARLGADFLYRAIAIVFTVVAILAIIEFATGFNPFLLLTSGNSLYFEWGTVQERGGRLRAEGAFGHSIALGASLALAIPLTLASTFRFPVRLAMVIVMATATAFTFSRIGIISAFLGVALCVVLLRERLTLTQRWVLTAGGAVLSLVMLPFVSTVFSEAGEEATGSADYRGDLLPLLDHANLVGFSDLVHHSPTGALSFGNFQSIDSQLIFTGLTTGTLALIAVCIALAAAIVLCLRGRAEPATIAVVAQIPAFATVALITQYSIMIWLVIGIAATTQLARQTVRVPSLSQLPSPIRLSTTGE